MALNIIAFGANLGLTARSNANRIQRAARDVGILPTDMSRLYRTPAFPPGSGPDYVNAVGLLRTAVPPSAVLARLHAVETRHGRRRDVRWGARLLDLDLLAVDGLIRPDPPRLRQWIDLPAEEQIRALPDRLVLPHPRLQDRAFVLVPLCDVAPSWRHPLTGRTAQAMRDGLPAAESAAVRPLLGLSNHRLRIRS
ncbi:MAG: 2-amino-4-hydroxy-6-hydroxymethyldihydropteridine diphosphokinase [Pseudomonadota bacterium]